LGARSINWVHIFPWGASSFQLLKLEN